MLLWFVLPSAVLADPLAEAIRLSDFLLHQQEQRDDASDQQLRQRETPPPMGDLLPELPSAPVAAGLSCLQLTTIRVVGSSLFSGGGFKRLTEPFLGRCVNGDDLNRLLAGINRLYFERGYVTTRAYLAPQDVSAGVLVVTVIEGTLERIEATPDDEKLRSSVRQAFPLSAGDLLNLRDLEQGLDNLHRLESNSITLLLEPGSAAGRTVVQLRNDPGRSWQIATGIDNFGQRSTGHWQGYAALGLDNLLGLADDLSLSVSGNLEKAREEGNRSLNLSYEVPAGDWLFRIDHGSSSYQSRVEGVGEPFETSGDARVSRLSLKKLLFRDQRSKFYLDAALTLRSTSNYLEDVRLDAASRRLSVTTLGLAWQRRFPGGTLRLNAAWNRGLTIFNAREDDSAPAAGSPRAQFDTLAFGGDLYLLPVAALPRFGYACAARGQFSADPLFGSEQLILGGYYSIRGYRDDGISGDLGGYLRQELSYAVTRSPERPFELLPFIALDVGSVRAKSGAQTGWQSLAGTGFGVRLRSRRLTAELFWGEPLVPPASVQDDQGVGYLSLQSSF